MTETAHHRPMLVLGGTGKTGRRLDVGYVPSGAAGVLLDLTGLGAFLGLWLQFAGASVALVAGTIAVARTYRAAPKEAVGVTGRTGG